MTGMSRNMRRTERPLMRESVPMWGYVQRDTFDAHMQRLETLMERNMVEQKAMNDQLRAEMKASHDQLRAEMKASHDQLRAEMKAMNERLENKIDSVRTELKTDIGVVRTELKADIKALDSKIYSLDERLSQILVIVSIIATVFGIIVAAIRFWK